MWSPYSIHTTEITCMTTSLYIMNVYYGKKNLVRKDNRRESKGISYPTLREQLICLREKTLPLSDEALSLSPSKPWVCKLWRTGSGGQDTARCSRRVCFLLEMAAGAGMLLS